MSQMAEVNDLFIRSLRNSTRKRPVADVTVGQPVTPSKHQTPSWLTGRHSVSGDGPPVNPMPPDLLANLTPRTHPLDEGRCSSSTSTNSSSTPIKRMWSLFASKKSLSPGPVKEYQVVQRQAPLTMAQAPPSGGRIVPRRHSCLLNPPLESQVRVIPTWFPPATISRLKRQDSFHGETAASRLLGSKQRAFRMSGRTQRETTTADGELVSCSQTIMEEPERISGGPPGKPMPRPTKSDRPASPVICPRHAKHHSISPLTMPKSGSTLLSDTSSPLAKKPLPTTSDTSSKSRKPKTAFKFGTLPRSFKVSGTGRVSPSPLSATFRPTGSPTPFTFSADESPLRSTPPVFRRLGGSLRKSRNRNSWHVTVPVLRPDVALPEDKAWFDPTTVPSAQQKLCACGDTRKHVHLVKFGPDLTLTDTRYFVAANGDEVPEDLMETKDFQTDEISYPVLSDLDPDAGDNSDSHDEWGTIAPDEDHEDVPDFPVEEEVPEPDVGQALDQAVCAAHQEIDAITTQDKSMLRKLLDMSDQIRHWNGSRTHRIRSVDSSPVTSLLNISAGNKSLGNFPGGLDVSISCIPEEMRLPRTYSMESLHLVKQQKGQVTQVDSAGLALRFANTTSAEVGGISAASNLRTNMHLSYSDLLKNSSKFWQQPSQPGSLDPSEDSPKTSLFVLREASLSLLL